MNHIDSGSCAEPSRETSMTSDKARREFLLAGLTLAAAAAMPGEAAAQAKRPGRLSTHVLDLYHGTPGAGVRIDFYAQEGDAYKLVKTVHTNADGRTDEPILPVEGMAVGRYRLVFHVAEYFKKANVQLPDPPFIDKAAIDFAIYDPKQHYHVPLLCSPWTYTTYRGS